MQAAIDPASRTTILVHYYRAMVGRADVWRTRLDTTANWAIGATAAIISFALGNAAVPHYVVFIASLMTLSFLLLEARRLTFYHLWQQRVLLLERELIRPALAFGEASAAHPRRGAGEGWSEAGESGLLLALEDHLGQTVPTMPIAKAVARRLRRVYLYIFGVQMLAWLLKLANHPDPIRSPGQLVERADVGILPGEAVVIFATVLGVAAVVVAFVRGGVDRRP